MEKIKFSDRLTPELLAGDKYNTVVYNIPIYQRLFEWGDQQITQLLDDLCQSFKDNKSPYYIGMLTSNKNKDKDKDTDNGDDLIDGQQRFTVMMLLGIELKKYHKDWQYPEDCQDPKDWHDFLYTKDGNLRLNFSARPDDKKYLSHLNELSNTEYQDYLSDKCECKNENGYENPYMKRGLKCIKKFIEDKFGDDESQKSKYSQYVFENMSFFISYLPNNYSSKDLNKYFETMNSTGKNLENHEKLKVDMLKRVSPNNKVRMTRIWNAVSDMDCKLIRSRGNEDGDELSKRFNDAFGKVAADNLDLDDLFESKCVNDLINEARDSESENVDTIGEIAPSSNKPTQQRLDRDTGFRSILSFSEFLLQVLWIVLDKNVPKDYSGFFDVNKLLDTFKETFFSFNVDADGFIVAMLRYRLLYDRYVISIYNEDNTYDLNVPKDDKKKDEFGNSYYDLLLMYESMLYVNSSAMTYYRWLPGLLQYADEIEKKRSCEEDPGNRSCKELYQYIKQKDEDDERHQKSAIAEDNQDNLSYDKVDRYWFWKLDFHIWRCRKELFKDKDKNVLSVADKYVFRRNRSIEHIAPRTRPDGSTLDFDYKTLNCFGNLVMISSSQNSSLSNSTFEMKRAKVQAYIKGDMYGTVESLKMLLIYQNEEWNEDRIKKHEEECIEMLKKEYGDPATDDGQ